MLVCVTIHGSVRMLMVETRTQHRSGRMAHATRTASDASKSKKVLVEYTTIVGSMVLSNSKDVSSFHHCDGVALYESRSKWNDHSMCQQRLNGLLLRSFMFVSVKSQSIFVDVVSFQSTSVDSFFRDKIFWLWALRPAGFIFQLGW